MPSAGSRTTTSSASSDVDKLLGPKSLEQLTILETHVQKKLQSHEPIDHEYWEQLLHSIDVFKAKAELKKIYQSVVDSRLRNFKQRQATEVVSIRERLRSILERSNSIPEAASEIRILYPQPQYPQPVLKISSDDRGLEIEDEQVFLDKIVSERQRVFKMGSVPGQSSNLINKQSIVVAGRTTPATLSSTTPIVGDDISQATKALYDREAARGVLEGEEIFAGEEDVATASKTQWEGKYRPRKPRYFNRVQMGYEWNKYNQTHYDHDNPPPKVVQGYKFNIFYPDLIDKTKAPSYKIERENGRKRGQTLAPAGEEDTCLIRFISGPPYEDIAFRIVDKEWDYSAKRERGFRSSFDKGILQLHFQFKKVRPKFHRKHFKTLTMADLLPEVSKALPFVLGSGACTTLYVRRPINEAHSPLGYANLLRNVFTCYYTTWLPVFHRGSCGYRMTSGSVVGGDRGGRGDCQVVRQEYCSTDESSRTSG